METATISIRFSRLADCLAIVNKINKKASKSNIPGIIHSVGESYTKKEPRFNINHRLFDPKDLVERQYIDVTFTTETVVIGGYKPIATLDFSAHETPTAFVWPEETMGNDVPTVPECSHCGKNRRRSRIFILENIETGTRQNVGSSCVRDYIGYEPKAMLEQLTIIREILNFGEGDEDFPYGGGRRSPNHDLAEVMAATVATNRVYGWVSGKRAMDDERLVATSFRVQVLLSPVREYREEMKDYIKGIKVTKADKAKANTFVDYVKAIESPWNDYVRNLTIIAREGFCTSKEYGYAVSMANFAENGLMREEERKEKKAHEAKKKETKANDYIGDVGEKVSVNGATVTLVREIGTAYGASYLTKFETVEGNVLTWFASSDHGLDKGDVVKTLTGKVKAHNEFRGTLETVLTRCKIS